MSEIMGAGLFPMQLFLILRSVVENSYHGALAVESPQTQAPDEILALYRNYKLFRDYPQPFHA
jgi:hypothetical protein